LIVARWPEPVAEEDWEAEATADFTLVMDIVRAIRNLRAEKNVKPGQKLPAVISGGGRAEVLLQQSRVIAALARLDPERLNIQENLAEKPEGTIALVVGAVEIYLPLVELVDVKEERDRLEKDLRETLAQIERLETLLAGPFADKAPPEVIEGERRKLEVYREKFEKLTSQIESSLGK
jgi:valyl-tRNA synthetase